MIVLVLALAYLVGFAGLLALQAHIIAIDPDEMPEGGRRAVVIRTLAWPLILVGLIFVVILMAFDL